MNESTIKRANELARKLGEELPSYSDQDLKIIMAIIDHEIKHRMAKHRAFLSNLATDVKLNCIASGLGISNLAECIKDVDTTGMPAEEIYDLLKERNK